MNEVAECKEFHRAFLAVQKEIEPPILDGNNGHFKSKYSTLRAVLDCVKPILTANGFYITQGVLFTPDFKPFALQTTIVYKTGESKAELVPLFIGESTTPQQGGSALTYAKRQGILAMFGVVGADDDDDGNGYYNRGKNKQPANNNNNNNRPIETTKVKPAIAPVANISNNDTRPWLDQLSKVLNDSRMPDADAKEMWRRMFPGRTSRDLKVEEIKRLIDQILFESKRYYTDAEIAMEGAKNVFE